ncbi:MAG: TIR domain-containing protein [Pseudomonadota bacterium]
MSDVSAKPVIFISYSHKDEPDHPREGEIQWLSFVRTYLQPAVKHGIFDLWVDLHLTGGVDLDPEIKRKLQACDIFILLVSASSMASSYITDTEIATIRERQARGEDVHFYPLLLTPTPDAGLNKVKDKNLRPRDARPFSGFPYHDRLQHMTEVANEIGMISQQIVGRKSARTPSVPLESPAYVHITGLPETAYEKLRGRDDELTRLDNAWIDRNTNILSLIAEGGAGKSALVNEWLKRMRADSYRGAETVLGWSFYSQGTKERATSAEQFLNWAIDKLSIEIETTSATAKGEAIAEALTKLRVLLVLDGCEPLQHGLDKQQGELKDQGLRALLRRFAAAPPGQTQGLVLLTSRLAIKDIVRWKDDSAPVAPVDELSNEAGAALLRDNGVWGTDRELRKAARDFGGHPLALGLLASFLKETQTGDVRRRDHIRQFFADPENPRHDHARRVMESYEREWLAEQSVLLAILQIVGLFDRPASSDCLRALRQGPAIPGLTDVLIDLGEDEWQRKVARLRDARLLVPPDSSSPDVLDAHPLVREWFGQRLEQTNNAAWRTAHGRLYEYLRDTTNEGDTPSLESLSPLYQAIGHGCRAGRHREALEKIYIRRICRQSKGIGSYAAMFLGAFGSDLAALSWFFERPFEVTDPALSMYRSWLLGMAGVFLRTTGRLAEAVAPSLAAVEMLEKDGVWKAAAITATNLSETQLLMGQIQASIGTAERALRHAEKAKDVSSAVVRTALLAYAMLSAGRFTDAERLFLRSERMQKRIQPDFPILFSFRGFQYCDALLSQRKWIAVRERSVQILRRVGGSSILLERGFVRISLGRSKVGFALQIAAEKNLYADCKTNVSDARIHLDDGLSNFRAATSQVHIASGLLARACLRRSVGDWNGTLRDLDEVEEIAEPGPMRLYLCDMALERVRLAFSAIEAFAPLKRFVEDDSPKPIALDAIEEARLKAEVGKHLAVAADYIETCGYHRRDEELAELQAVLRGERKFADLPPRV